MKKMNFELLSACEFVGCIKWMNQPILLARILFEYCNFMYKRNEFRMESVFRFEFLNSVESINNFGSYIILFEYYNLT